MQDALKHAQCNAGQKPCRFTSMEHHAYTAHAVQLLPATGASYWVQGLLACDEAGHLEFGTALACPACPPPAPSGGCACEQRQPRSP